ncbi:hypothetical protein MKX03_011202 [Papaver bracteatum]|nr:hypothetical protein MKX03_011202 [Papaver bracteatum]
MNLSPYSVDHYHQFEHKRCLCVASIKESGTRSGVVELYILKDRIKQVWVTETITFDFPVTVRIPPQPTYDSNGNTYNNNENLTSIQIIELAGKILVYFGKLLVYKGRSPITQFYDLKSRELIEVRVGSKFYSDYHVANHVENFMSLRAWATRDGYGGELGQFDDISTSWKILDVFKQMPPSHSASQGSQCWTVAWTVPSRTWVGHCLLE